MVTEQATSQRRAGATSDSQSFDHSNGDQNYRAASQTGMIQSFHFFNVQLKIHVGLLHLLFNTTLSFLSDGSSGGVRRPHMCACPAIYSSINFMGWAKLPIDPPGVFRTNNEIWIFVWAAA